MNANFTLETLCLFRQVWAHSQGFPNGVLLRAFVNCYELDIIDEHAFLLWKEDVNDFYPGKGQALFQVSWSIRQYY